MPAENEVNRSTSERDYGRTLSECQRIINGRRSRTVHEWPSATDFISRRHLFAPSSAARPAPWSPAPAILRSEPSSRHGAIESCFARRRAQRAPSRHTQRTIFSPSTPRQPNVCALRTYQPADSDPLITGDRKLLDRGLPFFVYFRNSTQLYNFSFSFDVTFVTYL